VKKPINNAFKILLLRNLFYTLRVRYYRFTHREIHCIRNSKTLSFLSFFFFLSNIILSLKLNKYLKKRKKMEKEKSQNKLRIK